MEVIFFVLQRFVMYYWSIACLFMFYHKWSVLFLDEIEMRHHDTTFIDWTDLLCSQERCSWKESPGSSNPWVFFRDIVYEGLLAGSAGLRRPQRTFFASFFFWFWFPKWEGSLYLFPSRRHLFYLLVVSHPRGQVETLRGDGKTKRPDSYGWQVGDEKTTGGVASLRGSDGFGVGFKTGKFL